MLPGRLFTDCHSQYRAMPQATVETFFVVHNCIRRAKCAFVVTHFSSLHLWCSVPFIPPALRYILHFDILQGRFYPHDCAFLGLLLLVFDCFGERDLFGFSSIWIGRVDPYQNMLRKVLFCNDSTEKTANVELRKTMQWWAVVRLQSGWVNP